MMATPVPGTFGKADHSEEALPTSMLEPMALKHPPLNPNIEAQATINRTVTIKDSARVVLEDKIVVGPMSNTTALYSLNYSIPSSFQKFVEKTKFYVQYGDDVGLTSANNTRQAEVFVGKEITTYTIPVTNSSGFPATNDTGFIYAQTYLETTADIHTWKLVNTEQQGSFVSPIRPLMQNLNVTTADAYIILETSNNKFNGNSTGNYAYGEKTLSYLGFVYDDFDPYQGLTKDVDYAIIVFDSFSSQESGGRVVVPNIYENIQRKVRFDPYGRVYVTETFTVLHTGAPVDLTRQVYTEQYGLGGAVLFIENDAVITDVFDQFGKLNLRERNESNGYPTVQSARIEGFKALTVNFRTTIFGGETYTFTVTYRYEAGRIISFEGNEYTLNTSLSSLFNSTVKNMEVVYQLPEGATFLDQNYSPKSQKSSMDVDITTGRYTFSLFRHVEVVYQGTNLLPTDNVKFELKFRYSRVFVLTSIINYFVWSIILMGGILALGIGIQSIQNKIRVKDLEVVEETASENIPIAELEEFYNVFTEVRTTMDRLHDLTQKYRKGKVSRKQYDSTIATLRRKLKPLNQRLDKAVRVAQELPQKYRKLVDEIMLAHQRLADTRSAVDQNDKKYLRKEIPKDTYLRLSKEYTDQLNELEGTINRNLTEITRLIAS